MKSFRDLDIWKEAHALRLEIYKISSKFPSEEKFNLTSQIRRSSSSVADQIAEAHGRYYFADKTRVLYQGRGEAEEVRSQLSLALDLEYIKIMNFNELDKRYEGLEMRMSKYIKSLKLNRDEHKKRPN